VTVALLALLALQPDPRIESVERLAGAANRPYLWAPLAVRLTSAAGFEGDLVAQSSLGLRFVRRVRVPAHGSERVLLPAIDPQTVSAGPATAKVPGDLASPDRVVLVDSRLPYAASLASDDHLLYRTIDPADLERLLSLGVLDACDLLLVKDPAGLTLGSARAWAVAPTRAEAENAVSAASPAIEPVRLVDVDLWTLAPEGGWVPAKKERTVLLTALYALGGFAALVFIGRKNAARATWTVIGISALGVAAFLLFFPRRHLWVSESACEIVPVEGEAQEHRLWFAGAATDLKPIIRFPRIVKPVFPRLGDAEEPLTIRVTEQGSTAEGFALAAGRRICFAAAQGRTPSMRALERVSRPLTAVSVRRAGKIRFLGDLGAGGEFSNPGREGPGPRAEDARPWSRFLQGDVAYGWLDGGERPAEDVGSADLADARRKPIFFIQRLR